MSLVPCRACGHKVDTSALACPECGATDPGHKISRQQRNAIVFLVELVVVSCIFATIAWAVWKYAVPTAQDFLARPTPQLPQAK